MYSLRFVGPVADIFLSDSLVSSEDKKGYLDKRESARFLRINYLRYCLLFRPFGRKKKVKTVSKNDRSFSKQLPSCSFERFV